MNCVPGMVTEFAFTPVYTTAEYRELPYMIEKVAHINDLRAKKSIELVAKGSAVLDPYTFDYLLLCNKICGASHYNMQMKIIVDTPEDYKNWISEQALLVSQIKEANTTSTLVDGAVDIDSTKGRDTSSVVKVVMK